MTCKTIEYIKVPAHNIATAPKKTLQIAHKTTCKVYLHTILLLHTKTCKWLAHNIASAHKKTCKLHTNNLQSELGHNFSTAHKIQVKQFHSMKQTKTKTSCVHTEDCTRYFHCTQKKPANNTCIWFTIITIIYHNFTYNPACYGAQ